MGTDSRLMLSSLLTNASEHDPRKRWHIPAYHATSASRNIGQASTIALDITAIFVLHFLDLIEQTIQSFERVILPAGTLEFILNERSKVRFHQPSRIREADAIRREVQRKDSLKVHSNLAAPDFQLEMDAGADLAKLIATAVRDRGVVIRSAPIPKLGSLGEGSVELGEWKEHVYDMHEFVAALRARGKISEAEENFALTYLRRHDQRWSDEIRMIPDGPIYLDGLTLTYLWTTQLLSKACSAWSEVYVSQETFSHFTDLDAAIAQSTMVVSSVDRLRRILQEQIATGKIEISKRRHAKGIAEEDRNHPTMMMLAQVPKADAIAVDDRFINQHATLTDVRGSSVQVVTSLNVLDGLRARGVIDDATWRHARHRLRSAAVGIVPLVEPELAYHLDGSSVSDGKLIETQELRAIRENLASVAMARPLDPRTEGAFIVTSFAAIRTVIARVWSGASSDIEKRAKADWTLGLMMRPMEYVRSDLADALNDSLQRAFAKHFAFLAFAPVQLSSEQAEGYADWIDSHLTGDIAALSANMQGLVQQEVRLLTEGLIDGTFSK